MKSWKTTLGGLLGALSIAMKHVDSLAAYADLVGMLGIVILGANARDNKVTSEAAGAKSVSVDGLQHVPMLLIGFLALSMMGSGCSSPKQAAYRATGSVVITVDAAMSGWGDYVRAGLAKPQEEAKVKAAYEHYQATIRLVRSLTESFVNNAGDKVTLDMAFTAVDHAKNDLIDLIQSFRQTPKPKTAGTL